MDKKSIPYPVLESGEMLIYTIRHGLTILNRDKRVGGKTDVPLTAEGRLQAEIAHRAFYGTPFDIVISSPLKRAVETVMILTEARRDKIELESLCRERDFGQLEGLTREEVEQRFPQIVYLEIGSLYYSLNPPGGETMEQLRTRAEQFLEKLRKKYAGSTTIISSHQIFLIQFHGLLLGRDPYDSLRMDVSHLELNQFHLSNSGTLISHDKYLLSPDAGNYPSY